MRFSIFILILAFSQLEIYYQQAENLVQDRTKGRKLQRYIVNLDLPYEQRWSSVIQKFKDPIQQFWKFVEEDEDQAKLKMPIYKDKEFLSELKAISKIAGVSYRTTQVVSLMYELLDSFACTSIIARNQNGQIIHARNLDYTFADFISPLLAQVEFQSKGVGVYSADMIIGTVMVITGFRHNSYSITINERFDDSGHLEFVQKQYTPPCYLIHKLLRTKSSYKDALQEIQEANITKNAYFFIAGISGNQGTLIEKDKEKVHGFFSLSKKNWFICHTNYDRDQPDPINDFRRIPCEKKMKRLKGDFRQEDLYNILTQEPNFSYDTLTTDIMIPEINFFNSIKWFTPKKKSQSQKQIQSSHSFSNYLNFQLTTLIILLTTLFI